MMPVRHVVRVLRRVALLAFAVACGRDDGGAPRDAEEPGPVIVAREFPVRLLPPVPQRADELFEQDFTAGGSTALDGWWTLEWRGAALHLVPAAHDDGSPIAPIAIGPRGLRLAGPDAALLRFLDVPEDTLLVARAAVGPTTGAPGDPMPAVQLFPLEGPDGAAATTPADLIALGRARGSSGEPVRLERRIAERMNEQLRTPVARIDALHEEDDGCDASLHTDPLPRRSVWVLALVAETGPLDVGSVRVIGRTIRDLSRATLGGGGGGQVVPARYRGELRAAVIVPGESARTFDVDLPGRPSALTFAVAALPERRLDAAFELRIGAPNADAPAGTFHFVEAGGAEEPAYHEVAIAWPASAPEHGLARVTFTNPGSEPYVLAAPILRGPPRERRPNLLFVSLDTLRADRLGAYGHARPTSPFLDRFAAGAARFTHARAVAPFTLPSHATMFTGMLPPRHGVVDFKVRLDPARLPYLPVLLAQHGYATAAFTGGGYVSEDFGFAHGFDLFAATDPMRPADGVGWIPEQPSPRWHTLDTVAEWIAARHGRNENWFCLVHTFAVHNYRAPADVFAQFDRGAESKWRDGLAGRPRNRFFAGLDGAPGEDDVRYLSDLYDATVRYADAELERLFGRLDESGALEDTVIVVTSDHGEEFMEHGGLGHAVTLYEEMLAIPLIVKVPGAPAQVIDAPVTQADLAPTLLELLGLPPLADADGQSLAGLLRGRAGARDAFPAERPLFAHVHTGSSRRAALRIGASKLIRGDTSRRVRDPARAPFELFDLLADPGERNDLAPARQDAFDALRRRLEALESALAERAIHGVGGLGDESAPDAAALEQLRELGYVR